MEPGPLLRTLARRQPASVLVVLLCSAGAALAAVLLPAALGSALDQVLNGAAVPWAILWLCTGLTAAEVVLDALLVFVGGSTTAGMTAWLRTELLDRVVRAEPRNAQSVAPGDLTTRLTANAPDAAAAPVTAAGAVAAVLLPVGSVIGLLLIDPWTALALLAGAPALFLLLRAFTRQTSDATADYQSEQAEVATRLTEALDGAATIRAARTGAHEYARVLEPLTPLAVHGRRVWEVYGRATARSAVLLPVLTFLVIAVGGLRLWAGAISVGDLVAASRYAVLAAGIGSLTGSLGALYRSTAAARRLDPLLKLPAMPHRSLGLPPGGPGTLELRGVNVVRDGEHLLRDVGFTVPGGTSVAVVGRSGSGKSLLAAVAGRLSDPDTGTVTLDGVPLDGVEPVRLRHDVSFAFARPVLLGATVEDMIAFGVPRPSAGQVRSAAREASADGFIGLLPQGYRTPSALAPLSGGEYQRLGLARAFAHRGRLMILDDATSSLDTVTERQVQQALDRLEGTSTRMIVAHRLTSAADADLVVWLDEGAVRAVGQHRDLWADPAYQAVFRSPPDGGEGGSDFVSETRSDAPELPHAEESP
ncbi:ABC transporter ATP-binding protein [Streptomyces sp. NPDC047737]|uniref:ABC transporter ATP-binding protein n=1 Tax=unclassified Streptomyces TaxID=2593676 RepID=UPI0033F596B3